MHENTQYKKSIFIPIALFCGFSLALPCLSEEAAKENQKAIASPAKTEKEGNGGSSENPKRDFVIRVKTNTRITFFGTVTCVDPETKAMSLRAKGKTITFDMTNPTLIGYHYIGQIKKGDIVSVGYMPSGILIRKGAHSLTRPEPEPRGEKTAKQIKVTGTETTRPRRGAPIRTKDKRQPTSFQDVDNDKDGRISPIELTALIPDLSIERFKEYDKDGDGYLNKSEFNAIKKKK